MGLCAKLFSSKHTVASTITGGVGADVITGGTKGDSIFGGGGSDTLAGGLGADTLDGGTGTNTLDASGMTAVTDAGNTTSSGAIINLGATAISSGSATDNMVAGGNAASFLSGALSEVGAGKAAYLFATNAAGASSYVDTISNFTKIIGTAGDDYIVGNAAGAQTITGGTGADYLVGGSGVDSYTHVLAASVVYTATSDTNTAFADTETITFGNGVDVISNFTAGASGDKLDVAATSAAPTSGLAATLANNADSVNDTIYFLSGAYVVSTGVFTLTANGVGADTLIWSNTNNANDTNATIDTFIVLIGVDSDNLVAANFI